MNRVAFYSFRRVRQWDISSGGFTMKCFYLLDVYRRKIASLHFGDLAR
jgi:hypothetical protein